MLGNLNLCSFDLLMETNRTTGGQLPQQHTDVMVTALTQEDQVNLDVSGSQRRQGLLGLESPSAKHIPSMLHVRSWPPKTEWKKEERSDLDHGRSEPEGHHTGGRVRGRSRGSVQCCGRSLHAPYCSRLCTANLEKTEVPSNLWTC